MEKPHEPHPSHRPDHPRHPAYLPGPGHLPRGRPGPRLLLRPRRRDHDPVRPGILALRHRQARRRRAHLLGRPVLRQDPPERGQGLPGGHRREGLHRDHPRPLRAGRPDQGRHRGPARPGHVAAHHLPAAEPGRQGASPAPGRRPLGGRHRRQRPERRRHPGREALRRLRLRPLRHGRLVQQEGLRGQRRHGPQELRGAPHHGALPQGQGRHPLLRDGRGVVGLLLAVVLLAFPVIGMLRRRERNMA